MTYNDILMAMVKRANENLDKAEVMLNKAQVCLEDISKTIDENNKEVDEMLVERSAAQPFKEDK